MNKLRTQMLATTALAGAIFLSAPAFPQDAQPTENQATSPGGAPPAGPVEANPPPTTSSQGESVARTQDIIITGTRIPQPNLTSAAPITTVSEQDIKLSGATRLEDVIAQLPSAVAPQGPSLPNPSTGTAELDLRYLGSKRTLTLINGRRMTPGDPAVGSTGAGDINLIPASLIKRVEVLTGGASSVYGADAVAGVVNFIMDTSFEGIRFDGQISGYQHNNDCPSVGGGLTVCDQLLARQAQGLSNYEFPSGSSWDGRNINATISIGASFDDGRGHAVGYFGYQKQNAVLQSQRDYSACNLSGTAVPTCGGSATSGEGNFIIFDEGTSTIFTPGPDRTLMQGATLYNFAPLNHWIKPDERYTAGVFADYEISPAIKPYLEFMFMDDKQVAQIAPSGNFGNTFLMNCDNPFMSEQARSIVCDEENLVNGFLGVYPLTGVTNPGVAPRTFIDATGTAYQQGFFQVLRRNVEGGPRQAHFGHTSYRGVLGSRGDLSNAFSYDAYYQYGRVIYSQVFRNEFSQSRLTRANNAVLDPRTDSPTFGQPICRSVLDGSDPNCVPYDYFGGPSEAAIDYLNVTGIQQGHTSEQIANVNFTGKLGELGLMTPWADSGFGVNVGWEYRREELELNPDQAFQTADLTGQGAPTPPVDGSFHVNEFFAEAQLPIVERNFIEELSIGVGYRKSWYKTQPGAEVISPTGQVAQSRKYDTDTYKLSAEFAPIRDIRFRGSYNRAVRAPNILELFTPATVRLDGSTDPCAGITLTPTDFGCIAQFQAAGIANPIGRSTPINPAEQYQGLLGGNPDLRPEKATTKTLGVVLQPRFLPRFALTVDYWNIELKGAIQGPGSDTILQNCVDNSTATSIAPTCALIHRDPGGSLWLVPAGSPGAGFVENLPGNRSRIKTDGWDVNASYSHRFGGLGNLSASFLGTYLRKYVTDNGLAVPYDCAGFYGTVCSDGSVASSNAMPKWRHKARATLQMPFGLGLSLNWRHVGKVRHETLSDDETLAGPTNALNSRVKAQNYFDLAATYSLWDTVNLRAGVNNIFDRNPPIIPSSAGACPAASCTGNTYPGTWDYMGRYLYAGLTVDFKPRRAPPPAPVDAAPAPPPLPPETPPTTQICPDGTVVLATAACPAPPPPPPVERGERGS
jgi:outer membrane receptor protein involved in Fe transport